MRILSVQDIFLSQHTAAPPIYTLSLHDALPICTSAGDAAVWGGQGKTNVALPLTTRQDRKSTRLNSSHANNSYAVFCVKKKRIQLNVMQAGRRQHGGPSDESHAGTALCAVCRFT